MLNLIAELQTGLVLFSKGCKTIWHMSAFINISASQKCFLAVSCNITTIMSKCDFQGNHFLKSGWLGERSDGKEVERKVQVVPQLKVTAKPWSWETEINVYKINLTVLLFVHSFDYM